ncbi:hypothetical protein PTKIN_Ptkin14bG0058900 [Pterospermum kingtungense]
MAEAIPFGAMSNILSNLASLAIKEISSILNVNKELEELEETLGTINAVLLDAEESSSSSHAVKNWVSRLQDVVYDADDLLDEFQYEHLRRKVHAGSKQVCLNPLAPLNKLAFRVKTERRVKDIRERINKVAADIGKFNLKERVIITGTGSVGNSRRETDSLVVKSEIIGRYENKQDIISLLLEPNSNQENDCTVVIVGIGGLGKTALAQLVYSETTIGDHFSPKIWVCVSEEFDIKLLLQNILKSATKEQVDNFNQQQLQEKLVEVLGGKRFLIVLDDVWNEDSLKWDNFSKYLVGGAPGSKMLVTTRSRKVALAMGINSPYVLGGLNRDQSWDLFEQVAFRGQNKIDPKLVLIGKEVVERCKGVPLAIKTLASLMQQDHSEKFWLSVEENHETWKSLQNEDGIFSVLKLSYNHLPIHLRPCFAFCSIFPKDFIIYKYELIQLWEAQGYIESSNRNEVSLDLGEQYFNGLVSRSFFQEVKENGYGDITCKMHDLIHDLAQLVAGSSFCTVKDDKQKLPKRARHLFLDCDPSPKFWTSLFETKGIRTIIARPFPSLLKEECVIQIPSFSSFNTFRILDVSCMGIKMFPNSIGKLKHLRYLDLSRNKMEVLPESITNLHNLQTLLLSWCGNLKKLPKGASKLIGLESLDIAICPKLNHLPKGIGQLTSLQTLTSFVVNIDEKQFSTSATLNELRDLNYLGGELVIENLDMVRDVELESNEVNLNQKKHLKSLRFVWRIREDGNSKKDELLLDNLEPHPNLKDLKIHGYQGIRVSRWLSSITNLVWLTITKCCCQQLPRLDHLPSLKLLYLADFSALEYVADDDIGKEPSSNFVHCSTSASTMFFPSLNELRLCDCPNLKGWWRMKNEESTSELSSFPFLSTLEISNCPNLTSMPLFPSLDDKLWLSQASIRPLKQTLMMKTNNSRTPPASPSSSSFYSSSLSNLKELYLLKIDETATLQEEYLQNLTSLEHLKFEGCNNLESLPHWILTLTSLKTLLIEGCPQVSSLPAEGMLLLTSLKELVIDECPKLSETCQLNTGIHWPHIAQIPNIYIQDRWVRGEGDYGKTYW